MIVISGALVLVALVLLVMGVLGADLPFVYASIAVSTLSLLCLLVGILQRRGEPSAHEGDDLVPVEVPAATSVRSGSVAVAERHEDASSTGTLSQDLLQRGREDQRHDEHAVEQESWRGELARDHAEDQDDAHDHGRPGGHADDEDGRGAEAPAPYDDPEAYDDEAAYDDEDAYEDEGDDEDAYDDAEDAYDDEGEVAEAEGYDDELGEEESEGSEPDDGEADAEFDDDVQDPHGEHAQQPGEGDDLNGGASRTVLVVEGRPRYHAEGCRYLYGKQPRDLDLADAHDSGFVPCGVCKPDAAFAEPAEPDAADGHGHGGGVAPADEDDRPTLEESLFGSAVFGEPAEPVDDPGPGRESDVDADTDVHETVVLHRVEVAQDGEQVAPWSSSTDESPAVDPAPETVVHEPGPERDVEEAEVEEPAVAVPGPQALVPQEAGVSGPDPAASASERAPARKAQTKKAQTKKVQTNKAPTKRARPKKAPASDLPPAATAPAAKKAPAKKAPARKAPTERAPAKRAPTQKAPAASAAEPTPSTPGVRRIRAVVGAAPNPAAGATSSVRRVGVTATARPAAPVPVAAAARPSGTTPARRAGQVVVVPDRSRFHRPECRFVRDVPGATPLSRAAADRQGYEACGVCKP